MKNRYLRNFFLLMIILLVVTFGFSIYKVNKDIVDKSKWIDKIYNLKLINNDINTLITRPTGFYNYDGSRELIHNLHQFFEDFEQDEVIREFLYDSEHYLVYKRTKEMFEIKERYIHIFTSSNSVLNYAMRVLTTIITQMPQNHYKQDLIKLHSHLVLMGMGSDSSLDEIKSLHVKLQNDLKKESSSHIKLYISHVGILIENFSKLINLYEENKKLQIEKNINQLILYVKEYANVQINRLNSLMGVLVFSIFLLILFLIWLLNKKIRQEIDLEMFKKAIKDSDNHIVITDAKHHIEFANDKLLESSNFKLEEILGKTPAIMQSGLHTQEFYEELHQTISSGKRWVGEFINKDAHGNLRYEKASISPVFDEHKKITHYIAIKLDVTADKLHQKEIEEKNAEIQKRYYTDYLTGLRNRNCLMGKLDKEIEGRLYYININDFTQVKTFYGMKNSDEIIKKLAKVLEEFSKNQLTCGSYLFRIKFDEFCLWCKEENVLPKQLMKKLHTYIKHNEFIIDNTPMNLDITIGCSKNTDANNVNRYIEAEIAHHNARLENVNYMIYQEQNRVEELYGKNLQTIKLIQEALAEDRVVIYLQPIYHLPSNTIYMYEVLVRIQAEQIMSPDMFLETSKMSKYYHKIMRTVIKKTFALMRKNRDKRFSVNFSYIDFTNEATMSCLFEELLKCKAPQNLTLEILESENIQDYGIIKEKILQIKKFGCQISIDDFGAGHSNYYRLSQLDVDYIKIDGNIIKNLDKDTFSMQVIQSIVDFAKKSEYPVVAEYVHSEKILDIIRECGIEYAQGYYFAQPKLPSEIL